MPLGLNHNPIQTASVALSFQVDAEVIARRVGKGLPHAQVALGGLDRIVAQRELDLFEGGVAGVGQFDVRAFNRRLLGGSVVLFR